MPPKLSNWYRSTFGFALVGAVLLWLALPPGDRVFLFSGKTPLVDWLGGHGLAGLASILSTFKDFAAQRLPLPLWPLAWIAPIWWLLLARRRELPGRRPYLVLWLVGFLFWLAAVCWLAIPNPYTAMGWVALSFYLAFYLPVFVGLTRVAVHRMRIPLIAAAPVVWAGLELARGHLLTGFTMGSLGHTQYRWIDLIQVSDLAGAYGVGFVVMFAAACLARMIPVDERPRAVWPLVPLVVMIGAVLLYGRLRISDRAAPPQARIALIQGSVDIALHPDPEMRPTLHKQHRRLSEEAVRRYGEVDLIVWPESVCADFLFDYDPDAPVPADWAGSEAAFRLLLARLAAESQEGIRTMADELGAPLLLGVTTQYLAADGLKQYNSAVFVPRGGQPLGRYDKMHLVMYGEYVPFADELSWLVRFTPLNSLNIGVDAGTEPAAFELDGLRIAPNICYESVIPHVIRRQVNRLTEAGREPDVLVNLTNDGWFFGSSELDMHLVCGVFRAVECRKPFLIAANTGFSAWIDADGRIVAQGPRRATGTLLAEIGPQRRTSWYLWYGDWPAGCCLAACLALAAVGCWDRRHCLAGIGPRLAAAFARRGACGAKGASGPSRSGSGTARRSSGKRRK